MEVVQAKPDTHICYLANSKSSWILASQYRILSLLLANALVHMYEEVIVEFYLSPLTCSS